MYGALYTKPNLTLGESGSYSASGVTKMARAVNESWVDATSTKWGPFGLVSQLRMLALEAILRVSSSTGIVKPKAPKKEPELSVCSLSWTGDWYSWSHTPRIKRKMVVLTHVLRLGLWFIE